MTRCGRTALGATSAATASTTGAPCGVCLLFHGWPRLGDFAGRLAAAELVEVDRAASLVLGLF